MTLSVPDLAWVGLLGALLSLDRTALLQSMASRPVVAAAVCGHALGAPALGLWCGALLELIWLAELPIGGAVPPDDTLAGLLAVAFAVALPPGWDAGARAAGGVLAAVPCGYLGRRLDLWVRRSNGVIAERARREPTAAVLAWGQLQGATRFMGCGLAAAVSLAWVGNSALAAAVPLLPVATEAVLKLVQWVLVLVGCAAVLAAVATRRGPLWFLAGLAGGLGLAPSDGRWGALLRRAVGR